MFECQDLEAARLILTPKQKSFARDEMDKDSSPTSLLKEDQLLLVKSNGFPGRKHGRVSSREKKARWMISIRRCTFVLGTSTEKEKITSSTTESSGERGMGNEDPKQQEIK